MNALVHALVSRADLVVRQTDDPDSSYGYIPTAWICITFIALFSLTTGLHVAQATYYRLWWLFPTAVLAGFGEIIGWSARYWSSQNVLLDTPFMMQIATTIIAPTPFVGAIFIIMGKIIHMMGPQYSSLAPKWYAGIFLTVDVISLVIQALGGGLAASATTQSGDDLGANIMLAGIVFQMASITVFSALSFEFLWRYSYNKPRRLVAPTSDFSKEGSHTLGMTHLKYLLYAVLLSTLFLYIRAVYRTIELASGWNGSVIHTERYFNVLDGGMVTLAFFTLNVWHPGFLMRRSRHGDDSQTELADTPAHSL